MLERRRLCSGSYLRRRVREVSELLVGEWESYGWFMYSSVYLVIVVGSVAMRAVKLARHLRDSIWRLLVAVVAAYATPQERHGERLW